MKMEWLLIGLILLVVAGWLVGAHLKKKHYANIDSLDKEKTKLFEHSISQDFFKAGQIRLAGQSLETYHDLEKRFHKIETTSFPSIENLLFEAERATDRFLFPKASASEKEANDLIVQSSVEIKKLSSQLSELLENEEKNREESAMVEQDYQEIRNELLTNSFTYGPALEAMEASLTDMEKDFAQFKASTIEHDHMEANKVLESLKQKIEDLADSADRIPGLFNWISSELMPQIEELKQAMQQMEENGYAFPEKTSFSKLLELEKGITVIETDIKELKVEEAEKKMAVLSSEIENMYDGIEEELHAKAFMEDAVLDIKEAVLYLKERNRKLRIEADRLNQRYVLEEEEVKKPFEIQKQLDELENFFLSLSKEEDEKIVFTHLKIETEKIMEQMDDINTQQENRMDYILSLRKEETEYREEIEHEQHRLYSIRRFMEMQRLPGLPDDYLDLYFRTGERLEETKTELQKSRIDITRVKELLKLSKEDVDQTQTESEKIIDQAILTEYLVQYLNRYRKSNEDVRNTIEKSMHLFTKEYDYKHSLDILADKLDELEPGVYQQILEKYETEKMQEQKRS